MSLLKTIKPLLRIFLICRNNIIKIPFINSMYREMKLVKSEKRYSSFSTHEPLLADQIRMTSYQHAINKYVKKGDVVVDLGTGSGILSFFAISKEPKKIYALDHSKFIEKVKIIAKSNSFKNIIFVKENSKNFSIPEKIDLILHEQIGTFLFNEDLIKKTLDLRDRLLKDNGRILPSKFELFIVPVKLKDDCMVPLLYEYDFFNFSKFKEFKDQEYSKNYGFLSIHSKVDHFLIKPEKVLSFDLEKIKDSNTFKKICLNFRISRCGRLDGFSFYFRVIFDKNIAFTNSPLEKETHWKSMMLRCEAKKLKKGDLINFELNMKEYTEPSSWEWNYTKKED
jgi:ubiquinone/menaquinone biosynthesis C-methylase UbiE